MSRLIESIRLEDGRFHRLPFHQKRVDRSTLELFQSKDSINLSEILGGQHFPKVGVYKCRIIYDTQFISVEFISYSPAPSMSLKVVHDLTIDYSFKFEDRSVINDLFEHRQYCDDILIVRNGFVTDASYSNIVFHDGSRWITPKRPLLKGTMRQCLLDTAEIKEESITVQDIPSFKSFRLINAMHGFDGPEIEVSKIVL